MFREDRGRLLLAATLCVPVNQFFFLSGARLAPTTHVGVIYATCPLVVLMLATALGQERFQLGRLAGVLLTVCGALVIAFGNLWNSGTSAGVSSSLLRGDLLLFGAVASWGGYITVNKPLVARYGSLTVLAGTFLVGSVLALPLAVLSVGSTPPLESISRNAWLGVAHLALVVTVIGLACQNQALKRLDASQVATVGNAAPLLTILWGVWLLGESITPTLVAGGALVLIGIVWAGRSRS
jgi:drug/metabolite transporter (DMT)-like permease